MTIANHLTVLLNDGKTDVVDMLTDYINSTTLSINRYRKIVSLSRTVDKTMLINLINGKISSNYFIDHCRNQKIKSGDDRSFKEIMAEIRDDKSVREMTLTDTANLFTVAIDSLDENVLRMLSDEYINTFSEDNKWAKDTIIKNCQRLTQIVNVISSLIET